MQKNPFMLTFQTLGFMKTKPLTLTIFLSFCASLVAQDIRWRSTGADSYYVQVQEHPDQPPLIDVYSLKEEGEAIATYLKLSPKIANI